MGVAHALVGQDVVPAPLTRSRAHRGRAPGREGVVDRDLLLEGAGRGRHLVEDLLAETDRGVHAGVEHGPHVLAHHDRDRRHRPQPLGQHGQVVLVGDHPGARIVGHPDRLPGGHDPTTDAGAVVHGEVLHRRGAHPEGLGEHEGVALSDDPTDGHRDARGLPQGGDRAADGRQITPTPLRIARGTPGYTTAGILLVHEVSSHVRGIPPPRVGDDPPQVPHITLVSATIRTWPG